MYRLRTLKPKPTGEVEPSNLERAFYRSLGGNFTATRGAESAIYFLRMRLADYERDLEELPELIHQIRTELDKWERLKALIDDFIDEND